jgi:hypothetical protein
VARADEARTGLERSAAEAHKLLQSCDARQTVRLNPIQKHVNGLGQSAWHDRGLTQPQPKSYEQAVGLLTNLRELAARKDEFGFQRQMEALRATHGGKRTLIARLDKAGL